MSINFNNLKQNDTINALMVKGYFFCAWENERKGENQTLMFMQEITLSCNSIFGNGYVSGYMFENEKGEIIVLSPANSASCGGSDKVSYCDIMAQQNGIDRAYLID